MFNPQDSTGMRRVCSPSLQGKHRLIYWLVMDEARGRRLSLTDPFLLPILVAIVVSLVLFSQTTQNANVKSRIFLTLSMVEDGVININRFHEVSPTGDVARIGDDYYSDKAPGISFTALPFAALGRMALALTGQSTDTIGEDGQLTGTFVFLTYLCQIATSGLGVILMVLALYRVALRLGADHSSAAFGVFVCVLATPLWGWATAFFGHALATSLLFIAFAMLVELECSETSRRDVWLSFAAGLCLAWAFVVEFTTAPASLIVGLYGLYRIRTAPGERIARCVLAALAGCALAAIPLLLYNHAAFGSFLKLGYSSVVGFDGMQRGFFGINLPKYGVVYQILLGERRGLAWLSPILVVAPFALLVMLGDHRRRAAAVVAIAVTLYYLLMNSGYHYWDGGWSTGPRHITPIIPFLSLSLVFLWSMAGMLVRSLLVSLALVSYLISLVCVSMTMMVSAEYDRPLQEYLIPAFTGWLLRGESPELGVAHVPYWFGVPPLVSIPLLVVVTLTAVLTLRQRLRRRALTTAAALDRGAQA
jgi:hypothetical protein